jgi:hypothetical protein
VGHVDVDVDAVALGSRGVHLLEPHPWSDPVRVADGTYRPVGIGIVDVGQHRRPERAHRVDVEGVDGHLEGGGAAG